MLNQSAAYEYCNPSYFTLSNNILGQEPKFVDVVNHDYHLQSNSAAIYAGYALHSPPYDHDGYARPQGNSYDIGAYEYVSAQADTTPPSIPTGLLATVISSTQINLSWLASTDNVGVTGYKVYRNGTQIATTSNTSYSDTGLSPSTTYKYTVSAYDAAGNNSNKSGSVSATTKTGSITYLSDLTWVGTPVNGWGPVEKDTSNGEYGAGDGHTITLNGVTYAKGLGAHANSEIRYNLGGSYSRFLSDIGVDDEEGSLGSIVFQVWVDGTKIYDSGVMTGATATKTVDVDVSGKNELKLVITNAGDNINYDHGDWANARLIR
jgi:chitodextrinase